jgi:pyruvate/2-oxoglutarate dehydrogenase complex dihydrolipoamide acyltransferase (E2) component
MPPVTDLPPHRIAPWPELRNLVTGFLDQHRPHTNYGLIEVDVTDALARIQAYRRALRIPVSFHAFTLYCLAQAAKAHPGVQTFRRGRRQLVTFEDVDVATALDRRLPSGERLPVGLVVRKAQDKSLAAINHELRRAAKSDLPDGEVAQRRRRIAKLPGPIRRWVFRRISADPFKMKALYGTIALTNLQNQGVSETFFVLPPNVHTATIAIGSITDRVVLDGEGRPVVRKMVCLTGGLDHAVLDGAPIARFSYAIADLMRRAAGLDESFLSESRRLAEAVS